MTKNIEARGKQDLVIQIRLGVSLTKNFHESYDSRDASFLKISLFFALSLMRQFYAQHD